MRGGGSTARGHGRCRRNQGSVDLGLVSAVGRVVVSQQVSQGIVWRPVRWRHCRQRGRGSVTDVCLRDPCRGTRESSAEPLTRKPTDRMRVRRVPCDVRVDLGGHPERGAGVSRPTCVNIGEQEYSQYRAVTSHLVRVTRSHHVGVASGSRCECDERDRGGARDL